MDYPHPPSAPMYTEPIDKSLMTQGLLVFEQDSNPDTAFLNKPFRSQYFAFFVIRGGSITFNINFREYNFGPREVIFLPPVVVSECKYISPDCSFIGMAFYQIYWWVPLTIVHRSLVDYFS